MEDGLLRFIGQLLVAHQLLDLALGALDVGLVREVGGEEHRLVADALERIGQRDLAALAVEVDAAGTDVLARALQIGRASVGKECRSRWSPHHSKKKGNRRGVDEVK